MRWKIIAVNSAIVLLVGLLCFALLRASLGDFASNQTELRSETERALAVANARLELDALRTERWLSNVANDKASREVFRAGITSARQEGATDYSNRVLSAAASNPSFHQGAPTLVAIVDQNGIALGRNSSNLMRGEDLGAQHPPLKAALANGTTVSEVWADTKTSELMSVTYAPVRNDDRQVLGMILMGTPLNDERLQRTSEATSGRWLILGIASGTNLELKAKSAGVAGPLLASVGQGPLREQALATMKTGRVALLTGGPVEYALVAGPLSGYGNGQALLIAATPATLTDSLNGLLWPVFGVTALGVLLVLIGGYLLGNYISQPVGEIEEGLLAILNGKTDLRFEIEHAELGGLVFRLNSLLNQLMGVQEDDTDEDGRPSRPPAAADFSEALAVDERSVAAVDLNSSSVSALRAEPAMSYYERLFSDYIAAKRSVGDPVEHITEENFTVRIRASEQEMLEKHGKAVRYRVEVRGREVVLLAVPMS